MNKSIETLMNEHRRIERVLDALETFAGGLAHSPGGGRATVARFALFFRDFADKRHHGKEEDRLFRALVEHGFPKEHGPVAVMLAEHDEGRAHVGALARIGAGEGPLGAAEIGEVARHALAFAPLLRAHIQKEDQVLYPMAQQVLPPADLEALNVACAAFDRQMMSEAQTRTLEALAEELAATYPADPARKAAAPACFGCGGQV